MKLIVFVHLLLTVTMAVGQDSNENKVEVIEVINDIETTTKSEQVTSSVSPTSQQPTFENESTTPATPTTTGRKRKIFYINQQQSGKFNVHLEFNDVSLVVIPKTNDPQLSLLNLLLKSAQKSNLKAAEEKKKKQEAAKVNGLNEHDYSTYKKDNYEQVSSEQPSIESRAPYHVDISSTLHPVVNIHPRKSNRMKTSNITRIPLLRIFKPVPVEMQPQNAIKRISKRSIDTSFLGMDSNVLSDHNIPDESEDDRDLINAIEHSDSRLNEVANDDLVEYKPEFMLIGATENCGPGRRRNSYQICVPVPE